MTLLDEVLELRNLTCAWDTVAENDGIPGTDAISIVRWRRNWEERLVNLAQSVRCNHYYPHKLRVRRIPKRNNRGFRTLRIPTVTDRVLQRACSQILMPFFEPKFLDCSFGYRPGIGLRDAVQKIIVLRENEQHYVLNADIDAFFDSVDHELLLRFLQDDLPDESLLPLIERWMHIGSTSVKRTLGIPQGSPLSPLLANIYLHRFDLSMCANRLNLVRYADDFVILCESSSQAERSKEVVKIALTELELQLEPSKTFLSSFEEGFEFLGVWFERDEYSYKWKDKKITVTGDEVDYLFSKYGGGYN